MKVLVYYPGHMTSTVDVAIGWENGLKECGCDVDHFFYHDAIAFYQAGLQYWGDHNALFEYDDGAALYMASTRAISEIVRDPPDVILMITGVTVSKVFYDAMWRLRRPMAIILTESPYADKLQLDMCEAVQFDAVFVNEKASVDRFAKYGATYLPHSYDPARHFPRGVNGKYKSDVFFLGTMYPERKALLASCNWDGIDARLTGPKLGQEDGFVQMGHEGRVPNEVLANYYAGAKVSLNLHRTVKGACDEGLEHIAATEAWSIGPRAYEIAACGGFQIAQAGRGETEEVFGSTVPVFGNGKELEETARYYLDHEDERRELARLQQAAVLPCSFAERARQIVLPVLEGL